MPSNLSLSIFQIRKLSFIFQPLKFSLSDLNICTVRMFASFIKG